jgi:hypothetical protein
MLQRGNHIDRADVLEAVALQVVCVVLFRRKFGTNVPLKQAQSQQD